MGYGSRILIFVALFRVFDRKIDYVHSCVTKRVFDSTKILYLSIDFFNRCFVT